MTDGWLLMLASPFIGSFLGTLIARLPEGRPVLWARSTCPHCGVVLGARDLVPLVSYAVQAGRCRRCAAPIGRFHVLVELAAMLVALSVVLFETDPDRIWADAVLGWALLALAWIDARTLWLPDVLTWPLLLLGLSVSAWLAPDDLVDHGLAALVGYAAFAGIAAAHRWLRGSDGLGGGDAKLMGVAGAWLGLVALPWVAALSAIAALAAVVGRSALTGSPVRDVRHPFGPAISATLWLLYLLGIR